MANRIADSSDVITYPFMIVGDVILDTPTSTVGDGKTKVFYANIASAFSGARFGCTVWINGSTVGTVCDFRFTNGGNFAEWTKSDINNPVHIKPFPGTQLKMVRNATDSNAGYTFLCLDIKYVIIDGENDAYPGLRDGLGVHSTFLRGTFGFWASGGIQLTTALMFSLNSINGGSMTVRGVEVEHGFAAMRFSGSNVDLTVDYSCERCYLHDGVSGEGFYLGATHGPPLTKLRNLNISDCVIARRAAESIQIQHLISSAQRASVRNFVVFASAQDWMNAFQPFQDGGIQVSGDQGNNYIENGIIDGWGGNGLTVYGSDQAVANAAIPYVFQNCLFNDGRGIFYYINSSTVQGMHWIHRKLYLANFNNTYYTDVGDTIADYYIGSNNGTDLHSFAEIFYDGSGKNNLFQDSTDFEYLKLTQMALPAIQYKNSGWYERAERFSNWKQTWGNYFPNPNGTPVHYYVGDIATNIVDGKEFKFYKCLVEHDATALNRPDLSVENSLGYWMKLSWDLSGVRNDQSGWNAGNTQSDYAPDDFRLVSDNFWNVKGMGLLSNEANTAYSQYQWYRSSNSDGSSSVAIPGAKQLKYTPQLADVGKYLALAVKPKDSFNNFGDVAFSDWVLVDVDNGSS